MVRPRGAAGGAARGLNGPGTRLQCFGRKRAPPRNRRTRRYRGRGVRDRLPQPAGRSRLRAVAGDPGRAALVCRGAPRRPAYRSWRGFGQRLDAARRRGRAAAAVASRQARAAPARAPAGRGRRAGRPHPAGGRLAAARGQALAAAAVADHDPVLALRRPRRRGDEAVFLAPPRRARRARHQPGNNGVRPRDAGRDSGAHLPDAQPDARRPHARAIAALQQHGLGAERKLGCGLFIPHKDIADLRSRSD